MTYLAYTRGTATSIIPYNGPRLENVCKIMPGTTIVNVSYESIVAKIDANGGFVERSDGLCYSNVAVNGAPSYYLMNGFNAVVYEGDAIRVYAYKQGIRENFNFQKLTPCTFISSYAGHIFNSEASSYAYVYGGILQTFEVSQTALSVAQADCLIFDGFKLVGMVNPKAQRVPWIKLPNNERMSMVLANYLLGLNKGMKSQVLSSISPEVTFEVKGGNYALLKTDAIASSVKNISDKLFQDADYTKVPNFGPCTKFLGIQPTKDIYEGRLCGALVREKAGLTNADIIAYVYDGGVGDERITDLQSETKCYHYVIINSELNNFFQDLANRVDVADETFMRSYSDFLRLRISGYNAAMDEYLGKAISTQFAEASGIACSTEGLHVDQALPQGHTKVDVEAMLQRFAFDFDQEHFTPTFGPKTKAALDAFAREISDEAVAYQGQVEAWKQGDYEMTGDTYLVSSGIDAFEPSGCDGVYPLTVRNSKAEKLRVQRAIIITNPETHVNTLRLVTHVWPAHMQAYTDITGGNHSRTLCAKILRYVQDTLTEGNIDCTVTLRNPVGFETWPTSNPFGWVNTSYKKSKARRCGAVGLGILTLGVSCAFGVNGRLTRWGSIAKGHADFDPMDVYEAYIDIKLNHGITWNKSIDPSIDVYKLYEDYRLNSIADDIAPVIEDLLGSIKDAAIDKYFVLVKDSMVYSIFTGLLHSNFYLTYSVLQTIIKRFDLYRERGLLKPEICEFLDRLMEDIKKQYENVDLQLATDTKLYNIESFDAAQKVPGDAESFVLYQYMED